MRAHNETYHSEIRCTPKETWKDETGMVAWQNRPDGEYAKKFKKKVIERRLKLEMRLELLRVRT